MSYVQSAKKPNPVALMGALGVPATVGAVLVVGLAVKVVIDPPVPNPDATIITPKPIEPPPPPEVNPEPTEAPTTQTQTIISPPVTPDIAVNLSNSNPITTLPDTGIIPIGPVDLGGPIGVPAPSPTPALPDPIKASPANNPGRWVTDSDYRTPWIRREWSGVAGFALTVDAKGKVSDCTITRSTGHTQMDEATCSLVKRRARFDPAKDSYGNPISGSYRSSVNWRLPE